MAVIRLPCQEIVIRALLKKNWINPETMLIMADAFIRDPRKDGDGLSVNLKSRTDVANWLATFNQSFGADSLHSGRIRDLDPVLDVSQTEESIAEDPCHAVITGLPYADDDPGRAESLASRLRDISRNIERQRRRK